MDIFLRPKGLHRNIRRILHDSKNEFLSTKRVQEILLQRGLYSRPVRLRTIEKALWGFAKNRVVLVRYEVRDAPTFRMPTLLSSAATS